MKLGYFLELKSTVQSDIVAIFIFIQINLPKETNSLSHVSSPKLKQTNSYLTTLTCVFESRPSLHPEIVCRLFDEVENELPQLLRPRHLHLGLFLVGLRVVVPRLHLHAPART